MDQQYFVILSEKKVAGGISVSGQVVTEATAHASSQDPDKKPKFKVTLPKPFEVKWILGPNGEGRAFAEAMGYETVEHDDFSYPPRR